MAQAADGPAAAPQEQGGSSGQAAQPSPSGPDGYRRRSAWLYVLGMVAAIALAWAIHEIITPSPQPHNLDLLGQTGRAGPGDLMLGASTQPTTETAEDVRHWFEGSDSVLGLERSDAHPGGFAPPAGALRLRSYNRTMAGMPAQHAAYEISASIDAVVQHYQNLLEQAGFTVHQDREDPASTGRSLVFLKGLRQVVVSLRPVPRNATMVHVAVTVFTPPTPGSETPAPPGP